MADDEQTHAGASQAPVTDPVASEDTARPTDLSPAALKALQHMESLLGQIRGTLDATVRDGEHKEFSIVRLAGSILQVIVAGLVLLALLDWLLQASVDSLLVKLAFAAVLQLSALTAFVVSRERG